MSKHVAHLLTNCSEELLKSKVVLDGLSADLFV
jgi:hypothetical protein